MENETNATVRNTVIMSLPFKLSDEEKLDQGTRSARAVQEVLELRHDQKESNRRFKEQIEDLEKQIKDLSQVVASGTEWRDVECEERFYYATGEVVTIWPETGDQIDVRAMTPQERRRGQNFKREEP